MASPALPLIPSVPAPTPGSACSFFPTLPGCPGATPTATSNPSNNYGMNPLSTAGSIASATIGGIFSFLFTSRFAAVILGLICIAGAIYLFKSPDVIQSVKSSAKAATAF